ncbi:MAG: MATE family efflux transporter, partial [Pseudomonadota bacterium]|nr:MATE family efflux transporter [Pseudomonadota bacterium]
IAFVWQTVVAVLVIGFRHQILALSGAEGETARLAARYLAMSMPSLTIMAISLVANGALRAQGDGARSLYVTLVSGAVAMVVDPLLIYGLGLGLDGAAMGINLFRIIMVGMALRYAIGTHDLLARPALADVRATLAPYLAVALPAILTQLATPSGNYLMTTVIARYGDEAVAGWAVVGRLTVVAFGGIFSLAGAIGGIFGQNFGAGQHDRLRTIYRDALVFGLGYTAITWAILALVSRAVIDGLALGGTGAQVVVAFTHVGAGGFLFATALFVSNAAFNALGRPLWGTLTTWARDGVFSLPLALWLAAIYGAAGVIYAQAAASALVGVVAAVLGWRFVQGLAAGQLVPEAPIVTRSLANADRVRRR